VAERLRFVKLLLVGGGGREHALAWKLTQDSPDLELVAAPGNPGIASLARCEPVSATDTGAILALAQAERADVVLIGPEAPLAAGIVDLLREHRIAAFGPTRAAAQIETSKRLAKQLMRGAAIPTANASHHTDLASAKRAIDHLGAPVVVKASGLAAGKGVFVCESVAEAKLAAAAMLQNALLGAAGAEVLVEEYMEGEELSVFAVTDGDSFRVMLPAQDHKRLLDGDRGPNTGGMGAYAPVSIATDDVLDTVAREILDPTLAALREHGIPFTGLLYAGLMLTADGPKVVEFNCRFGDPETQAILPLMSSSLLDAVVAVARGDGLAGIPEFEWRNAAAVTTVVAAAGYPDGPRTGDVLSIPHAPDDVLVFHAGTARTSTGELRSAGGRVLGVTAIADTFDGARSASMTMAESVQLNGKQIRRDIGWREAQRLARVT
jgi:phosphoribosylamine--glycine ligase